MNKRLAIRIAIVVLVVVAAVVAYLAWNHEPTPIRIGFIGGLSGRVADLGAGGRDGVILAVEEINRRGGINGRKVELLIRDDKQDAERVVAAVNELAAQKVSAIVGPMTSSMSIAAAAACEKHNLLVIGPTTSTNELTGKDDCFFRIYPASAQHARYLAAEIWGGLKLKKASVVYDLSNRGHTESYFQAFQESYGALGGEITGGHTFKSGAPTQFFEMAKAVVKEEPHCVFVLANAMDTALLCQQFRKIKSDILIVMSEWSVTNELLEYGGKAVDGGVCLRVYDSGCRRPEYLNFAEAFRLRFGRKAGFPSTLSYDAAQVVFEALRQAEPSEPLGDAVLRTRNFRGLQGPCVIDKNGDASREYYWVRIEDGRFVTKKTISGISQ